MTDRGLLKERGNEMKLQEQTIEDPVSALRITIKEGELQDCLTIAHMDEKPLVRVRDFFFRKDGGLDGRGAGCETKDAHCELTAQEEDDKAALFVEWWKLVGYEAFSKWAEAADE